MVGEEKQEDKHAQLHVYLPVYFLLAKWSPEVLQGCPLKCPLRIPPLQILETRVKTLLFSLYAVHFKGDQV